MSKPTAAMEAELPRHADVGAPRHRGQGMSRRSPIALTLVAKAAETLTLVGLATLIPRALGPADYGVFAVFLAVALALDVAATLVYQIALALGRPLLWSFRFPLQNTVLVVAAIALHAVAGVNGALAAVAIASGTALAAGLPALGRQLRPIWPLSSVPPGALRFGILQGLG